ncbi:hypothetical protein GQF56_07060 [Rhodobacter sphaeroides]|nr:hypothetical protein [Cereibacter sphaeroides]QHA10987.1 hypothetical protein GQR99_08525 [Cereibacter sphaeroides]QHA13485.1 hypothetical protein GQY06_08505 [Cereibacter sphaeroides]
MSLVEKGHRAGLFLCERMRDPSGSEASRQDRRLPAGGSAVRGVMSGSCTKAKGRLAPAAPSSSCHNSFRYGKATFES